MSPSVTCYAQPDKRKSQLVLEAFAQGAGARIAWTTAGALDPGPAVFYGVRPAWAHLWTQAKAEGRDWYWIDNAYFDVTREQQFRVTRNAIQHSGAGASDARRFFALGLHVKPSRKGGAYVLACAQSDEFMRTVAGDPDWLPREVEALRRDGHQVLVRHKGEKRPLRADLENTRLLVTWGSAAAVEAVLEGVPVRCAPQCCAYRIEDRPRWAAVLADNQWSLEEMANGTAWRALNA